MREVTMYYAYDGTEFDSREECLRYERNVLNLMKEIDSAYSFFDMDMNVFIAPVDDNIDVWFDWFGWVFDECVFIYRDINLSDAANDFIHREFGCCIQNADFDWDLGWFQWSEKDIDWIKVDE